MNKVSDRIFETSGCCAEGVSGALDRARSAIAGAADSIIHAAPVERARAGARAVDDYAHESPWSFIGVVAMLALAAGLLLRRR